MNCDLQRDWSPSKAETALRGGRRKAGDPEVRSEFLQGAKQPTPMACRKVVAVARERGGRGAPREEGSQCSEFLFMNNTS